MSAKPKTSTAVSARRATKKVTRKTPKKTATIKTEVLAITDDPSASKAEEVAAEDEEDAVEVLGKELQEVVDAIRKLAQQANCQEIELRYEIGIHCRDVMEGDGTKFGDHAVQKLADALGWAPSIVYDHAAVARAWKTKEDAVAAAKEMKRGWRHLVTIASAPTEKQQTLIAAVRDDGMGLRALQVLKKKIATTTPRTKPAPPMEDTTPSESLVEAIEDLSDAITYCEKHGVPNADRLTEAVSSAQPTDFTPEFVKGFKELRGRAEAMGRKIIASIDAGLAAGKQSKAPPKATKAAPEAKPTPTKRKATPNPGNAIAISQNTKAAPTA